MHSIRPDSDNQGYIQTIIRIITSPFKNQRITQTVTVVIEKNHDQKSSYFYALVQSLLDKFKNMFVWVKDKFSIEQEKTNQLGLQTLNVSHSASTIQIDPEASPRSRTATPFPLSSPLQSPDYSSRRLHLNEPFAEEDLHQDRSDRMNFAIPRGDSDNSSVSGYIVCSSDT